MKPIVTWVVIANTRNVSVLVNRGPGTGLELLDGVGWQSAEAEDPRDRAGSSHSIAGHSSDSVEQSDPQQKVDKAFAGQVVQHLGQALSSGLYDRLIVSAGPHMLGLLREHYDTRLRAALIGEVAKDLTDQSTEAVMAHIEDIIAP